MVDETASRDGTPRDNSLQRALAPTRQRIERDMERSSEHARRMLSLMRDNLLDPAFNVNRIRWTLGLRSNDATTRFTREMGQSLKAYLLARRLEVACRLLLETDLTPTEIALAVGWRNFRSFSHTFNRKLGCRPRVYRSSGGLMSRKPPKPPAPAASAAVDAAPSAPEPPRFLAGIAAVAQGTTCARCGVALQSEAMLRVFEGEQPICALCALEHAPRPLVDSLFVDAVRRLTPPRGELADTSERWIRAGQGRLSAVDAEALVWSLARRHPRSLGVIRGILDQQKTERRKQLEASPS